MLAAAAKDEDEDYDFEDEDLDGEDASIELLKQRRLLAEVAQQARQYPGLDFDEIEDHEEIMRQIYEENLRFKKDRNTGLDIDPNSAYMINLQAEALANSGIDRLQALRMLKSQQ